ncbi:MAG: T9SS type A sorting domain-containing protein [Paludibacteraceae bacterium]|nr:T9SS type A sorting domain-containing protein [Paludibacteraceae bacterium]
MKKTYLLIMAFLAIFGGLWAQTTDVTATYLTNADFETTPTGVTVDNTIYDVPGWGETPAAGVLNYSKLGTLAYEEVNTVLGTVPANGSSVTDANTSLLGLKVHWGPATLSLSQTIVNLPAGKYTLTWDSYLAQVVTSQSSMCGYIIDEVATYDPLPTTVDTWKNHSLTFTLLTAKDVTISLGYNKTANVGSTSSPIFFADNVKLLKFDQVDKTALEALLVTANTMKADPQPVGTSTVYTDLDAAITAAQLVYDNASATLAEVVEQEAALTSAIAAVNSTIIIESRISTWTTLPYDVTSIIVNPSFESATANGQTNHTGWTNVGGFKTQNNTSFTKKQGTYYVEQWKSAGGSWTGLKLSQVIKDIPNGIYKLTAGALNEPTTTGGAFVYANEVKAEIFTTDDYTITVTVTNNQLEIGYEVVNGGNYVAVDNFRLSYISDGSPYLLVAPENMFFDLMTSTRTFTINGGNLTANATLTAPDGVTLDKTSLTPAEVAAGITVTATHDGTTAIANGEIVISTTGATNSIVTVNAQPDNATSAIVNPNFSNGTTGWTATTTAQNKTTATNQNVGAFEGTMPFYENWNASAYTGKIYQVVNNLPAGRYLLKMGVFANNGGEGLFVYGDSYETAVSNASVPAFFEVEFVTPGGSAEIGLNIKSGTNNWVGIDNVSLKYLGAVSAPLTSVSATNMLFTEASLSKTFTLTGANLTADVSLVSSVAGVTVLPATISRDDAELVAGKTITVTFDPAAEGAGSLTGTITVSTAGVDDKVIAVATSKDSECFTPLGSVNLIPDPYLNTLAPFAGWGHKSVVTGAEAYCGLSAVKFEATTNTWPDGAALDVNGIVWEANSIYRVRAMVKSVDGTFAFYAKGTNPDVTISIAQSNDEWVLIDQTFTTGAAPTTNFFSFNNVDGASTGKVAFIDNWELFKVGPTTSVSSLKNASKLNAYIQNGRVVANFEANIDGAAELALYNIQGVELAKVNANVVKGQNQYTFNAELPSGVYVIRMSENNITTAVKVVK